MAGSYVVSAATEMGGGRYGLYSGRPGTMSLDDFHDRLEAAFAKAKSKDKKLEAHEFLQQLPAYLENEALQVWCKKKWEILEEPEVEEGATKEQKAKVMAEWDPFEDLVTLFKKEFGAASAAHAFETAERIDLAQAYAEGHRGWQASELVGAPVLVHAAASIRGTVAGVARGSDGAGCFRCGEPDHVAARCTLSRTTTCGKCGKQGHAEGACWSSNPSMKPEWAGKKAAQGSGVIDPRDITIVELREEIDLRSQGDGQGAARRTAGGSTARKPSGRRGCACQRGSNPGGALAGGERGGRGGGVGCAETALPSMGGVAS
ncbi:hypothetical protein KFL_002070020 [Klebsormidium nitens]|uniref:CCHC-type domain-containing protein n=1 Tax=Klebsormidium nitens TaxID=105231 RepID=A0A1Y1I7Z4_KLENI|nr:hypothetical protein KFL_002070020 [Klebsormidium nitens]|eukprot:GAQ84806.1 hypothetical protein KFL_002070020 [Klebsormidium nitens]